MDRDNFLKLAKEFDDNYFIGKGDHFNKLNKEAKENNQTIKEYLLQDNATPLEWCSQINYTKIRELTLSRNENPFANLYSYESERIKQFFEILNETETFLKNFEKYEFDRLRTYDERTRLAKKYDEVIEDLSTLKYDQKMIDRLKDRSESLKKRNTIYLTKRRIFEDFLFKMHIICNFVPDKTKSKAVQIVNSIIKYYFDEDIHFSRKTDISKLKPDDQAFETLHRFTIFNRKSE